MVEKTLGQPADPRTLRAAFARDAGFFATLLARMAARLPHALVLVIDQAEELFTLARSPEEIAMRDHTLKMLQRTVDIKAGVKLIISLRTEYIGRLLDHLRAGRPDLTGVDKKQRPAARFLPGGADRGDRARRPRKHRLARVSPRPERNTVFDSPKVWPPRSLRMA